MGKLGEKGMEKINRIEERGRVEVFRVIAREFEDRHPAKKQQGRKREQ